MGATHGWKEFSPRRDSAPAAGSSVDVPRSGGTGGQRRQDTGGPPTGWQELGFIYGRVSSLQFQRVLRLAFTIFESYASEAQRQRIEVWTMEIRKAVSLQIKPRIEASDVWQEVVGSNDGIGPTRAAPSAGAGPTGAGTTATTSRLGEKSTVSLGRRGPAVESSLPKPASLRDHGDVSQCRGECGYCRETHSRLDWVSINVAGCEGAYYKVAQVHYHQRVGTRTYTVKLVHSGAARNPKSLVEHYDKDPYPPGSPDAIEPTAPKATAQRDRSLFRGGPRCFSRGAAIHPPNATGLLVPVGLAAASS
jgi:hypothetical protein